MPVHSGPATPPPGGGRALGPPMGASSTHRRRQRTVRWRTRRADSALLNPTCGVKITFCRESTQSLHTSSLSR